MTRRDKQKQKARFEEARQRIAEAQKVADISHLVFTLDDLIALDVKEVVAFARVSDRSQKSNGNLERERQATEKVLLDAGINPVNANGNVHVFTECCSGKLKHLDERNGVIAAKRAALIREIRYIVALTPSRFLRNEEFDLIRNPNISPNGEEWECLLEFLENLTPVVIKGPNLSVEQDEQYLAKIGKAVTGRKGGKHKKKNWTSLSERRKELFHKVVILREEGHSYSQIASLLNVKKSLVQKWVERHISNSQVACIH